MKERQTDILIVGGGVGGCAAAMAATSMGFHVTLTEPTDWIGGQLTAQAVPPDEHPWIEQFGCTRRYRRFRDGVRQHYRNHYPLTAAARADRYLNPGGGYVSRLCHEPRAALAVLEAMLAYAHTMGQLEVLLHRRPVAAETDGDWIRAVTLEHTLTGERETISARCILDATELGDLLPLAGIEYITGAESQAETGEPHAVNGSAQPGNVQAITWCFPMAYDPDGNHIIDRPAQYDRWREYVPNLIPPWSGRLFSWTPSHYQTLNLRPFVLFGWESDAVPSLWRYRLIVTQDHYSAGAMPHEVTLVNWPQNDYLEGNLIDQPPDEVERCLHEAKQLSLGLLYWMQTEAPRPDGSIGYPGLYLRPDLVGTDDGLAKYPYIRESRRIKALFTVTENHVGTEARGGKPAQVFSDSVGIGCYRIDLHPSTGGNNYIDISSQPFQIPLGALLPARIENLLPACKNIGTTHITNGCYRLHPVEWNIGEAAGLLAAFALQCGEPPRAVRAKAGLLADFQHLLEKQGIELVWPQIRPV
ncbi:MAG: FAD-dependent oxidoreductase [Anaerolineae bacterium]|nr:FAD-dependent oxidoreductase [Anaerolineae bacterium]